MSKGGKVGVLEVGGVDGRGAALLHVAGGQRNLAELLPGVLHPRVGEGDGAVDEAIVDARAVVGQDELVYPVSAGEAVGAWAGLHSHRPGRQTLAALIVSERDIRSLKLLLVVSVCKPIELKVFGL